MSSGSIADGFVEIQLKTDQMAAEMRAVIAETGKTAKAAEEAFNKVANRGIRKSTEELIRQRREVVRLGDEYRKLMGYDSSGGMSGGRGARLAGFAGTARNAIGSTIAASTALTFAAAASAGSTTFDTLTGSLRMLSLAAGAKTQGAVLGLSKGIQGLAHYVDKLSAGNVEAAVIGLAGASLGFRNPMAGNFGRTRSVAMGAGVGIGAGLMLGGHETTGGAIMGASIGAGFGPMGALAGAGIGAIVGELKALYDQKATQEEKLVRKISSTPSGLENAGNQIIALDRQARTLLANNDAMRSREASDAADMLRQAVDKVKLNEKNKDEEFKMAGLNMPMTTNSLAGAFDQGNMAMMNTSPLEMSNKMREWKLNMEGLRSRTSVDPNFVGPPQGN